MSTIKNAIAYLVSGGFILLAVVPSLLGDLCTIAVKYLEMSYQRSEEWFYKKGWFKL